MAEVSLGAKAKAVTAGWYHTCAILEGGAVRCWGYGLIGQLGHVSKTSIGDDEVPTAIGPVDVGGSVVSIAAGLYHTCAALSDGAVRCWGYGNNGQLGYGNTQNIGDNETPASAGNVAPGGRATQVAAGFAHSCAVLESGALRCWGDAQFGQLGLGNTTTVGDNELPVQVDPTLLSDLDECRLALQTCDPFATCKDTPAGYSCACRPGFVGDGWTCTDINECDNPKACDVNATCTNIPGGGLCACKAGFEGNGKTCADINECARGTDLCDGNATCNNTSGAYTCSCTPDFEGDGMSCEAHPDPVVDLVAGGNQTCALLESGHVRCWGAGILGYGNQETVGDNESPRMAGNIDLGARAVQLAAGSAHVCAVLESGNVVCWGRAANGRLGYGNLNDIGDNETPRAAGAVDVGGPVRQIAAGDAHTCALLETGDVVCWGLAGSGRLGYGAVSAIGDNETPASAGPIELGEPAIQITAGEQHSCALLESGAVRCWGANTYGQLGIANTASIGDNEAPNEAPAVNVGGDVFEIQAGALHTCALLATGNVRCWGYGYYGSLGYGNKSNIGDNEAPASAGNIVRGGSAMSIDVGSNHNCAVVTDGKVACWGVGSDGQLGYGSTKSIGDDETPASAGPVALGESAQKLALGRFHTCALLDSGVRCWGRGSSGQLGSGSTKSIGDDESPLSIGAVDVALMQ